MTIMGTKRNMSVRLRVAASSIRSRRIPLHPLDKRHAHPKCTRPDHQQSVVSADHQQSGHSPCRSPFPHTRGDEEGERSSIPNSSRDANT
jgi:hypothetical protein